MEIHAICKDNLDYFQNCFDNKEARMRDWMRKLCSMAMFAAATLALPGLHAQAKGEVYRNPFLSGATRTWVYKGDIFDPLSSKNRVFADDLEDGDLTSKMETVENTVDTTQAGEYRITYQVTDSDGNKAKLTTLVTVLEKDDQADKIERRVLYTLGDASHLTDISFGRGYNHDRQSLGFWLPAGESFEIRLANPTEFKGSLELRFMNNDSATEGKATIPSSGEFVTVKNNYLSNDELASCDSVPFVMTPKCTNVQPVLEFKWNENLKQIPYYRYKGDQEAFFAKWDETQAPYAILEGSAATFLVPIIDKDNILNSKYTSNTAYQFRTLDEMLEWYAAFVDQYDAFSGLDYYASEPYNQNVRSKFFIKANKSGAENALAYYSGDHSAYKGDILGEYLTRSWMSLHEFGHGYEGAIATQENPFVETTNNIMGFYFEQTYRAPNDYGWLLGGFQGDREQRLAALEQKALESRNTTATFSSIVDDANHYDVSLYMFTNVLDKLGPQKVTAAMHELYRKNYYYTKKFSSSSDTIIQSYSDAGGYNVIPYFESYHIHPSDGVEDKVYQADYPIIYYLHDLFPNDAETVRAQLGLDGVYRLVSPDDVAVTGATSQVTLQIDIDDLDQIRGKSILVKNGKQVVTSVLVDSKTVEMELPVGAYELELPIPRQEIYNVDNTYLIAAKGKAVKTIAYEKETGDPLLDDVQVRLLGMSDSLFAHAHLDTSRQKLVWVSEQIAPHVYYADREYANVQVLDPSGNKVYTQSFIGDKKADEKHVEIDFPVGSKLVIMHHEARNRLKFVSSYMGETLSWYSVPQGEETVTYVMTQYGLMKEGWSEAKQKRIYVAMLEEYSDYIMDQITGSELASPERFYSEKLLMRFSYRRLSKEEREAYKKQWGILLGIGQNTTESYEKISPAELFAVADSEDPNEQAMKAVDGDESTIWHSNYSGVCWPDPVNDANNSFTILLNTNRDVGMLEYVPRQDGVNGRILAYDLYYSTSPSGDDFIKIELPDNQWEDDASVKEVEFDAPGARRIQIRARATQGNQQNRYISAAEFYLYEKKVLDVSARNVYLSGIHAEETKTAIQKDVNAYGQPITLMTDVDERTYEKGIGLFTNADITYDLTGKGFDVFAAAAGMELSEGTNGSAELYIYGDETLLYHTGVMESTDPIEGIYLNITGVKKLRFQVTGSKEGLAVSLGNARFYIMEDNEEISLKPGEIGRTAANIDMPKYGEETVVWESFDDHIATVDENGNITAVAVGSTVIGATSASATRFFNVYVLGEPNHETQAPSLVGKLEKVQNLMIGKNTATSMYLTWDPVKGAARYEIWRADKGSDKFQRVGVSSSTWYLNMGLPKGTTYVYKVRAYAQGTYGEFSDESFSSTKPTKMKLSKVKKSGKKTQVLWKKNKTAEGVEVWVKQGKGKYKKMKSVAGSKTSVKLTKLPKGKKCSFKVRAFRKSSDGTKIYGAYSKVKSLKIR